MLPKNNEIEVELELLPDGTVRFSRDNNAGNNFVKDIIIDLSPSKSKEIIDFIDGAKDIEKILGENIMCG
jgi:hypothetical protein